MRIKVIQLFGGSGAPITLSKTPDELVNRKSGLSLLFEPQNPADEMAQPQKHLPDHIVSIDELRELAKTHLTFLLSDNQI